MLIVSMIRRQVLRRSKDGGLSVHANLPDPGGFHCNDMVVDAAGGAYVGEFGFDLDAAIAASGVAAVIAKHPKARLFRVSPDGAVTVAASEMDFPNGSVITPDGTTLIVGESLSASLSAFDIRPDGSLAGRRVWATIAPRAPDGIALNANGEIWIANPIAPECALIAKGGQVLEVIDTGQPCFACMLGGDDGRTLFMLTASGSGSAQAATSPGGKLLIATVDSPHAGRP
jgi:sugar lactone lactonase YvrE